VAEILFALLGGDLYRIASELQKLSIIVGTEKASMQHVKLIIAPAQSAEPWQVAEAAISKDLKLAMNRLSTVYKNMGDDADIPLSNALMRQVEKMMVVRSLLDRGSSEDDAAAAVGMHPFRFKMAFLPHVRKHSLKGLVQVMGRLCSLDANVKGHARSKRTLVELAVLSVAG
jgi:DNA polymerase III delta subunit